MQYILPMRSFPFVVGLLSEPVQHLFMAMRAMQAVSMRLCPILGQTPVLVGAARRTVATDVVEATCLAHCADVLLPQASRRIARPRLVFLAARHGTAATCILPELPFAGNAPHEKIINKLPCASRACATSIIQYTPS